MTREDLFEAIGALDEAMLDRNVEEVKKHRIFGWITGIAATAAIIAGVAVLPHILPQEEMPSRPGTAVTEPAATEPTTEFAGFLGGIHYYPLPEGSDPDAVCESGAWYSPKLGGSAYFVLDENLGIYQFVDPLSSAMPETGTYTIKDMVITASSYDSEDSHTFRILEGGYALELLESTSWADFTGRIYTSRYDAEKPFSDITAAQISNIICNDWELTLSDAELDAFVYHLRNVTRYQQITAEEAIRDGGRYIRFALTKNGKATEMIISHRIRMDGMNYLPDRESCDPLFDLLIPLAEEAQETAEHMPNTLSYLEGVTYRMLDSGYSYHNAYNSFTAAIGFDMMITFRSGNFRIVYLNPTWQEERGIYTMEDGFVICKSGEITHKFEIMDDYTIRLASSGNENITPDNFKDRYFTCRLFPEAYFEAQVTDAKDIRCGIRSGEKVISVQLPDDKVSECLDALHEITIYSESIGVLSQDIIDTEQMDSIFIDRIGDAQDVQVYIGKYIAIDGKIYVYEKETADVLFSLLDSYRTMDMPDPATVPDNPEAFVRAEISHYVLGEHREMSAEELAQLKGHLRNIVLLEEDTSGEIYFGDTLNYTLYREDGVSVTIQPMGNLITIGGRRFHTEYAPCETLNQFGHDLLGTRFAQEDSADAVFGILTNYVSASISHSAGNLLISGDKLNVLLEMLKPIEILGNYMGDPLIGDSPTITLTGWNQNEITIIPCHEQIWVDGTWYSCSGTEQLLEFCQNHRRD